MTTGLSLLPGKCYSRLAWGPENLIAAACGTMLHFLDARTGEVVERVDEAHDAAVSYVFPAILSYVFTAMLSAGRGWCAAQRGC